LDAVLPEGLPVGMSKEFQDSMRTALLVRQSFLDLRDNFRRVVDPPMWSSHSKGVLFALTLSNYTIIFMLIILNCSCV
jgi:small subunit ribosomal protein S29